MMLKEMMTNGITVAVAIGAMALVGCSENSGANNNSGGGGSAAVDTPNPADHAVVDTPELSAPTPDAPTASLALDDSSAEGALYTYLNRLKVGDFIGAAEICVVGAPGTDELKKMGQTIESILANPDDASLAETTKALFIGDLKTVEAVQVIEEDGVVVYEVKVLNKAAVNIRVEERDGAWWVVPPPDGLPMG